MSTPLFMFGYERSGTTLLSMMVGAHPQIAVPLSVTGLWYRYQKKLDRYNFLKTDNDIKSLVNDLLAEERIMLWDVELCRDDIIQGLPLGHFPAIIERFHYLYARALGKYYWANIDIATIDSIHIANKWFPEARFLHIVRDGRDVALSHETMPFGASNTLECAEQWCRRLHLNMMAGKILDSERYQIVKYEDLIIDTECTLKRICEFTEIAYSGAMLKYTEMVKKKVPEDKRWLWPVLDQPPQKSKVGKWKTGMGKAKRIVFENYAKDMLDELGYETYEKVPKFFPAYCYETWCFWGKGGRFRRMLNKVGLKKLSRLERSWMKMGKPIRKESSYETIQTTAFGNLVKEGVYSLSHMHSEDSQSFFRQSIMHALNEMATNGPLNVLDCGCGSGEWLEIFDRVAKETNQHRKINYHGFDLTLEMVSLAKVRLSYIDPRVNISIGDILKEESYASFKPTDLFHLVYTYDVIQQLPPKLQTQACLTLLKFVAPGGVAIFFDHDSKSKYGCKMGLKKFVTKYFGIPLVPRFYCNARYPNFKKIAQKISAMPHCKTKIMIAPNQKKRALFVFMERE